MTVDKSSSIPAQNSSAIAKQAATVIASAAAIMPAPVIINSTPPPIYGTAYAQSSGQVEGEAMATARVRMSDGKVQSIKIDRSLADYGPLATALLTAAIAALGLFAFNSRVAALEQHTFELSASAAKLEVSVTALKDSVGDLSNDIRGLRDELREERKPLPRR